MPKPHTKQKVEEWLDPNGRKILKLQRWLRDGCTDEQLAHNMCISYTTFQRWKKKEEFGDIIIREREGCVTEVENALYKRALGYDYMEQQLDKYGNVVEVRRHLPPDTKAATFYLTNRKENKWKTKVETQSTVEAAMEIEFANADNFVIKQKEQVDDNDTDTNAGSE